MRVIGKRVRPPKIAKYVNWDVRETGAKLDFKKRDASLPNGRRYLYLGWWTWEDLDYLLANLSFDEFRQVIRHQAFQNAQLYLDRKKVRDAQNGQD